MSIPPINHDEGFDVIVDDAGEVIIPASVLARRGIRPGTHLKVVPAQRPAPQRPGGRSAGKLAGELPREVIEEWSQALDEDRIERAAALGPVHE